MIKEIILNLTLMFTLLLSGCVGKKEAIEMEASADITSGGAVSSGDAATFENLYKKILEPKCASCHSMVDTEENLNAWIVDKNPEESPLFTSVEDGSMPVNGNPLSSLELDLVRRYIEQFQGTGSTDAGSSGGNSGGGSGGGQTYISFQELKSTILTPYRCVNCHALGSEAEMGAWINKSNPAQSKLYTSVLNNSMPTSNPKLNNAQKEFVLQYAKDYADTH